MESHEGIDLSDQKPAKKTFSIVSARDTDSRSGQEWKRHLDRNNLNEAWAAPEGSRWGRFEKTKLIDSVNKWANDLRPRYSEGEQNSEEGIGNLIRSGVLGKDTAVVLDSGGAHSVAMAVKLAQELGCQPIVMFNTEPHPEGANKAEQDLATLLYFAEEVRSLKSEGKIKPDAPPVFILDTHRNDFMIEKKVEGDNRYTYNSQDFPSAKEFTGGGITKIVYLNEGDQHGNVTPSFQSIDRVGGDLKPVVKAWEQEGIKMVYTGVKPWVDKDRGSFELPRFDFRKF